jgi:hypothetical protein
MTMLTRSKYIFHGEATIHLITNFISNGYFQFATMDVTTTIDYIEVIPTRTAVVETVHVPFYRSKREGNTLKKRSRQLQTLEL